MRLTLDELGKLKELNMALIEEKRYAGVIGETIDTEDLDKYVLVLDKAITILSGMQTDG